MPPVESTLTRSWLSTSNCTVPKVIDFPIYKTKSSGENEILCGILRVVSRFFLHFVLYLGNLSYFSDSVIPHPNFTWSGCRCDPSLRWCPPGPGAGWWVWGRGWDGDCGNHLAYPRLRGKEQTQPSGGFALTMQRCGSGSVPLWSDPDMFWRESSLIIEWLQDYTNFHTKILRYFYETKKLNLSFKELQWVQFF